MFNESFLRKRLRVPWIGFLFFSGFVFVGPPSFAITPGTWTPLSNQGPQLGGQNVSLLLTDGSVMIKSGNIDNVWYRLYPDTTGNYASGTIAKAGSMTYDRMFFGSAVLPDGRLLVGGGEYGGKGGNGDHSNSNNQEVYDPIADKWTQVGNIDMGDGDTQIIVTADGRPGVFSSDNSIYFSDLSLKHWTPSSPWQGGGNFGEESTVLMPDQSLLFTSQIFASSAYSYIASSDSWINSGELPDALADPQLEMGPGVLLYDGRVMAFGATPHVDIYNPSTQTWSKGKSVPDQLRLDDAPAAVMPNGHVLLIGDTHPIDNNSGDSYGDFDGPSEIFEYDPVANSYTQITNSPSSDPAYVSTMLILPNGQVLVDYSYAGIYFYTPVGNPDPSWAPTISNVTHDSDGNYTVTGTQLNGLTQGAYYGDDNQMSTNYPIIRLTDSLGNVYYAKSYDFSSMGVATGNTPVTARFTLYTNNVNYGDNGKIPEGTYQLSVIANGIASNPITFNTNPSSNSDSNTQTNANPVCSSWSNSSLYNTNAVVNYSGNYYQFVGQTAPPYQNLTPEQYPGCWKQISSCSPNS